MEDVWLWGEKFRKSNEFKDGYDVIYEWFLTTAVAQGGIELLFDRD